MDDEKWEEVDTPHGPAYFCAPYIPIPFIKFVVRREQDKRFDDAIKVLEDLEEN